MGFGTGRRSERPCPGSVCPAGAGEGSGPAGGLLDPSGGVWRGPGGCERDWQFPCRRPPLPGGCCQGGAGHHRQSAGPFGARRKYWKRTGESREYRRGNPGAGGRDLQGLGGYRGGTVRDAHHHHSAHQQRDSGAGRRPGRHLLRPAGRRGRPAGVHVQQHGHPAGRSGRHQ
ncbi:hypothetical protein B5E56_06035 [Flavonifractor sp. An112]|nr:hypothetical protein B5E56_06035 [Flavonifractor sp. An112]